jgi:hypothetical protein
MAPYRFWLQSSMAVVLALAFVDAAPSQIVFTPPEFNKRAAELRVRQAELTRGELCKSVCRVYSLSDLGDDPKLCKWIADTIPDMIQPATWKQADAKIAHFAPSRILVISNTPAVHAQVDEFLQNMKKSVAQARPTATPGLMHAQFTVPDTVRAAGGVQTGPGGYPVPFPPQTPKHLFHFIIRYEGEGIIDSNVVNFAKALKDEIAGNRSDSARPDLQPTPYYCPVPPPPGVQQVPLYIGDQGSTAPAKCSPKCNAPLMPPADAPVRSSGAEVVPPPLSSAPSQPPPPPLPR